MLEGRTIPILQSLKKLLNYFWRIRERNGTKIDIFIKGIAIFEVICAHCCFIPYTRNDILQKISLFWQVISYGGVALFFLISGYLFGYNKKNEIEFWKAKWISIIVPWIVTGTIVYCYVAVRKDGFHIAKYFFVIRCENIFMVFDGITNAISNF